MARAVKQVLPQPPPVYDQVYIAKLAEAVNRYIVQREALGELTTARLIMTDPPVINLGSPPAPIPPGYSDIRQLPNFTLYLIDLAAAIQAPAGIRVFTIVDTGDPE